MLRPLQELVERDRQLAYPSSGRVIDGIGQCAGDAGDADLSDAADAERIEHKVRIVDERHVDHLDVGVDRERVALTMRPLRRSRMLSSSNAKLTPHTHWSLAPRIASCEWR